MCSLAFKPHKKKHKKFRESSESCSKIITEGKFSYKEGLKELKLPTLEQRRENLTYNFAKKCASNPRTKNMFAQKEKKHIMQLRKTRKFVETKTNTQRHYNSAIPYMKRFLNRQEKQKQSLIKS